MVSSKVSASFDYMNNIKLLELFDPGTAILVGHQCYDFHRISYEGGKMLVVIG